MKLRLSVILSFFAIIIFLTSEILACACCAERGHYSIHVSKPNSFVSETMNQLKFSSVNLYTDAGYPDNINGIKPLEENYSSIEADFTAGAWNFKFSNGNSEVGKLSLAKPVSMVSYKVDLEASDEEKSMVSLYKEWRFKYKVIGASGIFKEGVDKNTEYFLVLRGNGNLCADPSDFNKYRLEISGKKANYSFFGTVSTQPVTATKAPTKTDEDDQDGDKFILGNLNGDYSGCSCSLQTHLESKKSGKWKTINFYQDLEAKETGAYLNVDGKDVKFKLIRKGDRPDKEKLGDSYSDVYQSEGITVTVQYTVSELPCEECEGTDYDVVLTAVRGSYLVKEKAFGSCGC